MHDQDPVLGLVIVGWVFTGLLLIVAVVCIAAGRGSLPPNQLVGLRLPVLMRDERSWRAGHAAGRVPALVCFAIALVCDLIGLAQPGAYWGAIAAFVLGLVWIVVVAVRAARRDA